VKTFLILGEESPRREDSGFMNEQSLGKIESAIDKMDERNA
jgi:hypothetical protein